jgi:hypothetical protein
MFPETKSLLLSTAYLPNIQYFSKFLTHREIIIEVNDTYQKQSFRNRTTILGANGPLDLVIPVKRPSGNYTRTRDVLLDYDMPWNKVHWKAIVAAYRRSPFFEFFEPEMAPFFNISFQFLMDWNHGLLDLILKSTGVTIDYKISEIYIQKQETLDYRDSIHPKKRMQKADPDFNQTEYFQVFLRKFGFVPNLSFIDLLFNEGPQAVYLCKKCFRERLALK